MNLDDCHDDTLLRTHWYQLCENARRIPSLQFHPRKLKTVSPLSNVSINKLLVHVEMQQLMFLE